MSCVPQKRKGGKGDKNGRFCRFRSILGRALEQRLIEGVLKGTELSRGVFTRVVALESGLGHLGAGHAHNGNLVSIPSPLNMSRGML